MTQTPLNLNALVIPSDDGNVRLHDASREHDEVQCYLKGLRGHLIRHVERADYVFGCVAWLTDFEILKALSKKRGVSIVVQKEDFLRPDGAQQQGRDKYLRELYQAVPCVDRRLFGTGVASLLSVCGGTSMEAIRCAGIHEKTRAKSPPRMHHKFAVFCKAKDDMPGWLLPYEVWTGSYNWSWNAGNSFENAMVTQAPKIAKAFYLEFQQILALSEPCDWTSEWVDPEWRIGT